MCVAGSETTLSYTFPSTDGWTDGEQETASSGLTTTGTTTVPPHSYAVAQLEAMPAQSYVPYTVTMDAMFDGKGQQTVAMAWNSKVCPGQDTC